MKKLKLSLHNIEGATFLTREQLKMVIGGSGDDSGGCRNHSQCGYQELCTIINYGSPDAYGRCCSNAQFNNCNDVCSGDNYGC